MKISSSKGNFNITQTKKNRDELLVLGDWSDITRHFGGNRTFLVNRKDAVFGVYMCKQECAEFMSKLIQEIGFNDLEYFNADYKDRTLKKLSS